MPAATAPLYPHAWGSAGMAALYQMVRLLSIKFSAIFPPLLDMGLTFS
jgi:hypothetical protein